MSTNAKTLVVHGAGQSQRGMTAQTSSTGIKVQFLEQEHLVVPVVAMVEGVRFGAAQDSAELGLAEDFGKYPASWNGRPLVVNHPRIDGNFVSAGNISVLEDISFGFIANTKVEDGKLKMEAWISLARAEAIPEVQSFVEQIEAGDTIEVSVGFWCDVEKESGKFNGQAYTGIWRNIVPDHLAFLTHEAGACSVADGCGVPRINSQSSEDETMSIKKDGGCGCGCDGKNKDAVTGQCASQPPVIEVQTQIQVNAVADGVTTDSVHQNVSAALSNKLKAMGVERWDVYLQTTTAGPDSIAVYGQYIGEGGWKTFGIRFDMDAQGEVSFNGEPFEVRVVTHIYEAPAQEVTMTNQTTAAVEMTTAAQTEVQTSTTATEVTAVTDAVIEQQHTAQAAKVLSQTEALAAMSQEDRTLVESALALQSSRKAEMIKALQDTGRCKFEDAFLNTQSLNVLESMLELAKVPDYSGRAAPTEPVVNAAADNGLVEAPRVFATK